MSSKVSLSAVFMIYQGRVKAIVQGKTLYDLGPLQSSITVTIITSN